MQGFTNVDSKQINVPKEWRRLEDFEGSTLTNDPQLKGKIQMAFQMLLLLFMGRCALAHAQTMQLPLEAEYTGKDGGKQIRAVRVNSDGFELDGKLNDEMWRFAEFVSDFLQKEPNEGAPPQEKTEVGFLYDDHALYVGAWMHSDNPKQIRALVTRRDKEGSSEQLIVSLDTYRDRRTAYSFGVTAAGVRIDYYHPEDDADTEKRDYLFHPVWAAKTDINSAGWTAEMRIPFSQLRFNKGATQVWGVNLNRRIPARNEDDFWALIPKQETGWASRFGGLVGIEGIQPSRRLELLPYTSGNATFTADIDSNNPFDEARDFVARTGADFKMGLGPSVTLFGTINPDFGQVEADSAKVNLSQFETFFVDHRPFFADRFQFLGGTRLEGPTRSTFFYPRRIGAPPHGRAEGDYIKMPANTTIVGATKVAGRLASGLSIGALTALTAREYAKTFDQAADTFGKTEVEPLTNFNVLRLKQEFGPSASTVGMMLTAVRRDVSGDEPLAQILTQQAYTGGVDWHVHFDGGKYELSGEFGFSFVEGEPGAIERIQRSSTHYFQRPDTTHVSLDPSRTSLFGYIGRVNFEKKSGRHWLWDVSAVAESPAFAPNDLSLLFTSDDLIALASLRYRETQPTTLFHRYELGIWNLNRWDYGGIHQETTTYTWVDLTWRNFMTSSFWLGGWPRARSNVLTRGGPLMGTAAGMEVGLNLSSSSAKRNTGSLELSHGRDEQSGWNYTIAGRMTFRPRDQWEFSVRPSYSRSVDARQYITTLAGGPAATFGQRYIFSFVDRSTPSAQLRLNYALTPDLSLEVYAEPFAASGRFYDFGELPKPGSRQLRQYGVDGTTIFRQTDGSMTIMDDSDRFTLSNRDFNVRSFRSNVVLRWEWRLGSTLFLVWQQDRSSSETQGERVGPEGLWGALTASGDNFIAVKVSNWLPVN